MLGISDVVIGGLFAIVGTFITTGGLIVVAIMSRSNRSAIQSNQDAIKDVHEEVKTNHGQRAGDYIEQIPVLATTVQLLAGQFEALAMNVKNNQANQEAWNVHHDEKDSEQFAKVFELLPPRETPGQSVDSQ